MKTLHARVQAAEIRNVDLSSAAQDSTRPLLRQIDSLQQQHSFAIRNLEEVERALLFRLQNAESERVQAVERERVVSLRSNDLVRHFGFLQTYSNSLLISGESY